MMLISRQVKSLASELKRVKEQMEKMQRTLDMMAGTSTDRSAAVSHTRQSAEKPAESRDTFNTTDLYANNTGPEPSSAAGSRGLMTDNSPNFQAPTTDEDDIEDDPLDELATMAPLGKMVTDAETIPKFQNVKTHSFNESPLSHRSDSRNVPETSTHLPGDPVALGLVSESKGRKLLEV